MKIEIQNLKKSFNQKVLFQNLSFTIHSHEMTCIYGPSGCGKTTLLGILGMIENKDSGIIRYDGKVNFTNKEKRDFLSKKVSFIFQNFGLIENETVYENLLILQSVRSSKNKKEKVFEALKKVGLENTIHQKVHELSGGEQQRIALTKIFLKNSDLILADEPTASLDRENKKIILNYLKEMVKDGKTVVIVTHDEQVKEICDRCINLEEI